jgi:uncharacterized protein YdaU (DUF1376 family)
VGGDPVNFWKRYPADYLRKTARLTLAQHGAYTLLLDELYTTEAPLPTDDAELFRICRAMNKAEQGAVRFVVERFFVIGAGGGLENGRASEELVAAAPAVQAARENGKLGGRPKKPTDNPAGSVNGTKKEPKSKAPQSLEREREKDSGTVVPAALLAADDRKDAVFALGLPMLTTSGVEEKQARNFLGFLRKHNTDAAIAEALKRCAVERAIQPIPFLQGCLKTGKKHDNRQESLEASNRAVGEEWLKEMQGAH